MCFHTGNSIVLELTELVGEVTKSISKDEALSFRKKLGLSEPVMQETPFTTRGPYLALSLYKEAERRNTLICSSLITDVCNGLLDLSTNSHVADDEKDKIRASLERIQEDSLKHDSLINYSGKIDECSYSALLCIPFIHARLGKKIENRFSEA